MPTKVRFFVWEVWWGKILAMDQLKKRGFSLASMCPFCGQKEEALEHLFIHCSKIWDLWTTLFSLSDGGWVCPYLVQDLLVKPQENSNFLKKSKMVISVKIWNFSRSQMTKRTSPLKSSHEI